VSKNVDYIISSLPKTEHVDQVLNMDDGVFANADPNTMILDTSTISPIAAKEFYAKAKKNNVIFIDSPMSGGIMGAQNATLTFMVGETENDDFKRASHVLKGMGKKIFPCGGPGTGQIAKIVNNMILGINMVAACEGMAMGEKLGIDPKVLCDILSVCTANSWIIDTTNPRPGNKPNAPASNNYNGGF
jgi:3-hydroxyisobutyrate dehydrogenase